MTKITHKLPRWIKQTQPYRSIRAALAVCVFPGLLASPSYHRLVSNLSAGIATAQFFPSNRTLQKLSNPSPTIKWNTIQLRHSNILQKHTALSKSYLQGNCIPSRLQLCRRLSPPSLLWGGEGVSPGAQSRVLSLGIMKLYVQLSSGRTGASAASRPPYITLGQVKQKRQEEIVLALFHPLITG